MAITLDFESNNPSSNLGRTSLFSAINSPTAVFLKANIFPVRFIWFTSGKTFFYHTPSPVDSQMVVFDHLSVKKMVSFGQKTGQKSTTHFKADSKLVISGHQTVKIGHFRSKMDQKRWRPSMASSRAIIVTLKSLPTELKLFTGFPFPGFMFRLLLIWL